MEEAVSSVSPFQQAYQDAKEQQSKDQAPASVASTEPAEDTQTAQNTEAQGAPTDGATTEQATDLVSDQEFAQIQSQFPNDPAKQRKELNKLGTQKLQKLAEVRKGLESYAEFIADFEANPQEAARNLAKHVGLNLPDAEPVTQAAQQTAGTIADAAVEQVRTALGPELDFLADKLAPAIKQVAESVAKAVTEQAVAPLKEQTDSMAQRAAKEQLDQTLATFTEKHPDWKQHEKAMEALHLKLNPGNAPNGMSATDYMELLYSHVTRDRQIADGVKNALGRLSKGAESAEGQASSVSESRVKPAKPAKASFREAYEAAKRGETWS